MYRCKVNVKEITKGEEAWGVVVSLCWVEWFSKVKICIAGAICYLIIYNYYYYYWCKFATSLA